MLALVSRENADITKEYGMVRNFALNTLSCSLKLIGTSLLELLSHYDIERDLIENVSEQN
jgi:hypothetical protein